MSKGLNNPKAFSTQDEAEASPIITPVQIVDGGDFPHTGLIKALSLGMKGNYATTGFNATAVTDNDVTFAAGVVYRDGKKVDVNAGTTQTIVIGSTSGTTTSYNVGYHLVVNATGTTNLSVRPPTGANAVPAYTEGDVIIAILAYTTQDPMQIQFLTVEKIENSLSIGYDASGYTESLLISSTSATNTSIAASTTAAGTAGRDLTISAGTAETASSNNTDGGDLILKAGGGDGTGTSIMSFSTKISGTDAVAERMRIHSDGNVGIGIAAPTEKLHIVSASNPTIKIQEDGQNGFLDLVAVVDSQAKILAENQTSGEGCILDLDSKAVSGQNQEVRLFRNANSASDGYFRIKQTGTNTDAFTFYSDKDGTAHKLTLGGGDIAMGNGQDSIIKVDATTSSTAGRDLTVEAGSSATGSANIDGGDLHLKSGGGDGTGTSVMTFSTKVDGTDTAAERMRIDTDGQVKIKSLGVGTAAEFTITESSDDITIKNTVSNKDIIFKVNDGGVDTEVLRLDGSTGNVGIGLAHNVTAEEKLDVEDGNISLTTTARQTERVIKLRNSGSTTSLSEIAFAGANTNNYEGYIAFKTKGPADSFSQALNEIMRIDGDGDVGIGTTDPDEKLHVVGNVKITNDLTLGGGDIAMGNGQDSTIKIDATTSSTAGRDLTLEAGSSATGSANINGGDLILKAGGGDGTGTSIMTFSTKVADTDTAAERMRISTTGKVGIGNTAPTQKLTISGSMGAAGFVGGVVEVTGAPGPGGLLDLSTELHRTVIADTTAFNPSIPSGGPLTLNLPAASGTHQGWEMRIVAKASANAPDNLTLAVSGSSDLIIDATGAQIGNASSPFALTTGKVYSVIHVNTTMYMCIILN